MSNQHNPHSLPPKSTRLQFDPRQFWLILRLMSEDPRLLDLSDIVLVTLNTGIRPGELSKLRWADVDIPKN